MDTASFSILKLQAALRKPARGHLFRCTVIPRTQPVSDYFTETTSLLCKATTVPSWTVEPTELSFFTRQVSIPGKRTFQPLTLTFLHTQQYSSRMGFEEWNRLLNSPGNNSRTVTGDSLYADIQITQYDTVIDPLKTLATSIVGLIPLPGGPGGTLGNITEFAISELIKAGPIATYKLYNAFPTSISGLQFSYESDAEIQTFDVEFRYQHMEFESHRRLGK